MAEADMTTQNRGVEPVATDPIQQANGGLDGGQGGGNLDGGRS